MFKEMIGFLIVLLLPSIVLSITPKTTCDLLAFPRECHCQRMRHVSSNETRLRCRQLTELTSIHPWASIPYDQLTFETSYDNLTVHRLTFANIIVRMLRFNVQHLFFNDRTFDHAYIGQLAISHHDTYGRIDFQLNSQVFSGAIITNLYFKRIDFQRPISESIFSNAKIYAFVIQSSRFFGFANPKLDTYFPVHTKLKHDQFLDYELLSPIDSTKVSRQMSDSADDSSSIEPDQLVMLNITSIAYPIYITTYTIIASINTTTLTDNYFPNNLDCSQMEEIELSYNQISSLDANAFRHLERFSGRLVLKNNQIKFLHPSAFDDLPLLKSLSLAKNTIQQITSAHFRGCHQLTELDLSFNQISQLHDNTFEHLHYLEKLYLNYNPLEFIHSNAFVNLTRLKYIHFQGIQFLQSMGEEHFQWIWNLASLNVIRPLKTDFDLSDVAFCILSRHNRSLFHYSREHSCSCYIHYFNRNANVLENSFEGEKNYLRLTPRCGKNQTESVLEQGSPASDLILQDLENQCDYKLMFVDCNAMTTTVTTTLLEMETELTSKSNTPPQVISETSPPPPISWPTKDVQPPKKSLNNIRKLFTVLATLIAITIGAILFVLFWYRFKTMLKRRKKKQNFVEHHQRHLNSPNSQHSVEPRYASAETLAPTTHSFPNPSQSEALIESQSVPSPTIYKNIEAIESYIDDESSHPDSPSHAITQC